MNSPITLKLSRCRVALCETKLSLIQVKKIVLRITETEVEIHNRLKWLDTNKNKLKAEELYLSTLNHVKHLCTADYNVLMHKEYFDKCSVLFNNKRSVINIREGQLRSLEGDLTRYKEDLEKLIRLDMTLDVNRGLDVLFDGVDDVRYDGTTILDYASDCSDNSIASVYTAND